MFTNITIPKEMRRRRKKIFHSFTLNIRAVSFEIPLGKCYLYKYSVSMYPLSSTSS